MISLNILPEEARYYLSIIEQRLTNQQTGAVWQKRMLKEFEQYMNKEQACETLVQRYLENCRSCQPVATWKPL